jgi:hypothetical protein
VEERIKSEKMNPQYEKQTSKIMNKSTTKAKKVSEAFSKGEKDLYKEVNEIKIRQEREQEMEE